jgi:hypothetical protein
MCVVVEHRIPKVASIRLFYLNYDDALWNWFAGIPGERDARGRSGGPDLCGEQNRVDLKLQRWAKATKQL